MKFWDFEYPDDLRQAPDFNIRKPVKSLRSAWLNTGVQRMIQRILSVAGRAACVALVGGATAAWAWSPTRAEPPHEPAPTKTSTPEHAPSGHDAAEQPKASPPTLPGKSLSPPPVPSSKSKGAAAAEKKPAARDQENPDAKGGSSVSGSGTKSAEPSAQPTPDEAITLLQEGNERWVKSAAEDPHVDASRRKMLADEGQKPFAAVLTCADSRIPVERVFDRGVGDVFVMRVAGNVAGPHEAGSIEYAAEHLHVPLLVVMGHTKCGAVGAAASHAKLEGNVPSLITAIEPAVERAKKLNPAADDKQLASLAVSENVWQTIFDLLKTSGPVRDMVSKGELKVVGAVYDIADGKVQWLGEHPWQAELVVAFSKSSKEPTSSQANVEENKEEHK